MKWIDVPQCLKETKGKEVPPAARITYFTRAWDACAPVGAESGKKAVLISKEVDGGPPVRLSDLDRHCLKF